MGLPMPQDHADEEPDTTPRGGSAKPEWLVGANEGAFDRVEAAPEDASRPTIPMFPGKSASAFSNAPPEPGLDIHHGTLPSPDEIARSASEPATVSEPSPVDDSGAAGEDPEPAAEPVVPYDFFTAPEPQRTRHRSVYVAPPETTPPPGVPGLMARLRTDPRAQLIVLAAAIAIFAALTLTRSNSDLTPIGTIHRQSQSFDGQVVKVRGRVGDVFPIGNSYAFNLHQGRDTIVVFTRYRRPLTHEQVVVNASVSTGYLEGQPRAALFENAP